MNTHLVLTVIGDDRPGLVGALSRTISAHGGNWLSASMAQLAGKFAGIVEVAVACDQDAALRAALAALPDLRVTIEAAAAENTVVAGRRLKLSLVGHDRIGIVREVSAVLARHAVNVERLDTRVGSAPMSADPLFHAEAELTAASALDAGALIAELEHLSNDLMVDITLDENIRKR